MRAFFPIILFGLLIAASADAQIGITARVADGVEPLGLNEPVLVELTYTNHGKKKATVSYGDSDFDFQAHAEPAAAKPRFGQYGQCVDCISEIRLVELRPGKSFRRFFLLDTRLSFDHPGRYQVTISLPGFPGTAAFPITVGERNEARLQSACTRWSRELENPDVQIQRFAAEILTWLRDEATVSCLQASTSPSHTDAIYALVNMDTVAAATALRELSLSSSVEVAKAAHLGLRVLMDITKKDDVREIARAVVAPPPAVPAPQVILR